MAKFPGDVMLDIDQIASLTKYSRGHIYNLASAEKLPFKLARELGDRILVSIIEMADYLDSKLLSRPSGESQPVEEAPQPKRGVGRPRGTTKAQLELHGFQSALSTAIYRFEVGGILTELRRTAEKMVLLSDDTLSCAEKFTLAKTGLMHSVGSAEAQFAAIDLLLSTPLAETSTASGGSRKRSI